MSDFGQEQTPVHHDARRAPPGAAAGDDSRFPPADRRRAFAVAAVYVVAFAWLLGKAALFRERVPPGIPPDETAHVSYAASVGGAAPRVPRYETARLLDDAGRPGPLPNYLPHPSLYYVVTGSLERLAAGGSPVPLATRTRRLRTASAPLFAAAAALFLWLGYRRIAPLAGHVTWAATVATVPPFAFVGAAVNNDVLAFLAGGVAFAGLSRRLDGKPDVVAGGLAGAGLALALFAKATAGLLVGFTLLGVVLLARRDEPEGKDGPFLLALLPGLLLPALHYLPVLVRYGTPLPTLAVVNPEAFTRSAFLAPPGATILPLGEWAWKVAAVFASTAVSIVAHVAVPVGPAWTLAGPLLLLALAAWGLLRPARVGPPEDRPARVLALAAALALTATLLLNLVWARAGYLVSGRVSGMHARYYLPLLPYLALAAALGVRRLPARAWIAAALALLLVAADVGVTARFLALVAR